MKGSLAATVVLVGLGAGLTGWFVGHDRPAPAPIPKPAPQVTTALPVESSAPVAVPEPAPAKEEPKAVVKKPVVNKPLKAAAVKPVAAEPVIVAQAPSAPVAAPPAQTVVEPVPSPAPELKLEESAILTPTLEAPPPDLREPNKVTLAAGTLITVRLREGLSSERNSEGDAFHATLDRPLVVEGLVIAEKGSLQRGKVASLAQAGKVKGKASLGIELTELSTSDGQRVKIQTETFLREGGSARGEDSAKVGVAAGIGAALGAMLGGGKGAALGAAIGGAAGGGAVLATRGPAAELESETRITFRLKEPVSLTEQIR